MKRLFSLGLFVFLVFAENKLVASDTLVLQNPLGIKKIKAHVTFYCDTFENKNIEDMLGTEFKKVNTTEDYFNFGFQHHPFWFKLVLKNTSPVPIQQYLEINRSYFPKVDLYELDEGGDMRIWKSGSSVKFKDRPVNFNTVAFDISINPSETKTYYLNIQTKGLALVFRPQLFEQQKLFKSNWSLNLYYGCYFGVLLIVIINCLFLYFVERRNEFLYYLAMVLSALIVNSFYSGYLLRAIQNFPFLQDHYRIFALSAFTATIFGSLFSISFLNIRATMKRWYKVLLTFIILAVLLFIATVILPYHFVTKAAFFITVTCSFFVTVIAVSVYRKGEKTARFFVIGYLLLCLGILFYGLRVYNVIPENNFTLHAFEFGTMLEMIFLFLALSDKQDVLKRKYEAAQKITIDSTTKSNEALRSLVHEQSDVLSHTEVQLAQQDVKVRNLEGTISELGNFKSQQQVSHFLNEMIYDNLKLRIDKVEDVLKSFTNSFSYFKSKSETGNGFIFGATVNGTSYFIVGENDLDSHVSSTMNLVTRSYFYNIILGNPNISPNEILSRINYYYKSKIQANDLEAQIAVRLGIIKIRGTVFEFSSAGQLLYIVNDQKVERLGDDNIVLGNDNLSKDFNFLNHTLHLEALHGSYFYLVAWSMLQERGGFSNEIFGDQRMSDLLKNMYGMEANDQKNRISELFSNWLLQGEMAQKSDWFVLGFELK